jgi:uncharacterized protein YacL
MTDAPPPPAPQSSPAPYTSQPAPSPYSGVANGPRTNTLAIISLVLAFFISLGAIITGHIALSQIKRTGESGRGLAIAGLVLGYIGFVLGFFLIILAVIFPVLVFGALGMDGTFSP